MEIDSCRGQGGYAVIIQPPAMPLSRTEIRRQGIQGRCTNIRAEIMAVAEACKIIRMILQQEPSQSFVIWSDSLRVVCMLRGEFETNASLGDVRELLTQWMHVKESVRLLHVRAHTGDSANEMADAHAKLAAEAGGFIP